MWIKSWSNTLVDELIVQYSGSSIHLSFLPNLIDVVQLEVLEKQQQDGGDCLHNDLFVPIDIHAELHALQHGRPAGVKHFHLSP